MTARTGLDLKDITLTKPSRIPFEGGELERLDNGIISLTKKFGCVIKGTFKASQGRESIQLDFVVYRQDGSEITDEEIEQFMLELDWFIASCGFVSTGEHKLVDIN